MPVGGEAEVARPEFFESACSCGRDALRLIIESGQLQGLRFVVPEFICDAVPETLDAMGVDYRTYPIDDRFSAGPIDARPREVVYLVNYFGRRQRAALSHLGGVTVIVDDVFALDPQVVEGAERWFSFNSLRKITPLADGALVRSNLPLLDELILPAGTTPWASLKYEAKALKHAYLNDGAGSEDAYLDAFESAEQLLKDRSQIEAMSPRSHILHARFRQHLAAERQHRERNLGIVRDHLSEYLIEVDANLPSFAPLLLRRRDEVRRALADQEIYLPVHWPGPTSLSQRVLSIPLDSRYNPGTIVGVCSAVLAASENR